MEPSIFVKKVVNQYNSGKGIFRNKVNAEELIPSDLNKLNKALYIFYVLQLDYAMKSQILYKGALKLHKEYKNFFLPKNISSLSDNDLGTYLKDYLHPRYINEAVKRYKFNTRILIDKYKGDASSIFKNVGHCSEVIKRLKDFRGFGPKIGTFFIRTMINTFGYEFTDIGTILQPVDVHDVRIAYILGYTKSDKMSQSNIDFVKKIWNKACQESGVNWLIFDKALWLLGSEGRPQNKNDILKLLGQYLL
jgi:endonuclease III